METPPPSLLNNYQELIRKPPFRCPFVFQKIKCFGANIFSRWGSHIGGKLGDTQVCMWSVDGELSLHTGVETRGEINISFLCEQVDNGFTYVPTSKLRVSRARGQLPFSQEVLFSLFFFLFFSQTLRDGEGNREIDTEKEVRGMNEQTHRVNPPLPPVITNDSDALATNRGEERRGIPRTQEGGVCEGKKWKLENWEYGRPCRVSGPNGWIF